ncbi:hypothetical protein AGMMS49525_14780 [Bacteroidia bacterium]|nr:hypothetical protein AGMMS49525_14780 [Bacteroidia bacterium]
MSIPLNKFDMPTFIFTASRLAPDNRLRPGRIEIDTANVTYCKGYVFGCKTTAIVRSSIASVSIGTGLFFADVVIESSGGGRITASGFKKADAQRILEILT